MTNIGLFYGSTTGKTETVAEIIQQEFGEDVVTLHNITDVDNSDFEEFVGLALDEDNQSDLTGEGIKAWVEQLKKELCV